MKPLPFADQNAPFPYFQLRDASGGGTVLCMPNSNRLTSLDLVRGVVMVLMVIDHVRVYSGVPAGGPTAGVFFTRWVTHFCAPAFVFFAGTAAMLHGRTLGDPRQLSRYLVTRGLLLVVLEPTLIRFTWTFNFDYSEFVLAGVIWMLGWCMVLLAGLIRLPVRALTVLGFVIVLGQFAFSQVPHVMPQNLRAGFGWWWEFVYPSGLGSDGPVTVLYTVVPWIGVIALGYAFGSIMIREGGDRRRLCLRLGLAATALFVIGAAAQVFMSSPDASWHRRIFGALNPSKYPATPMFLLMTLGPAIALLPTAEGATGRVAAIMTVFGRVPMFFYLMHIPLIHVLALAVNYARSGALHQEWYATAPYVGVAPEQRWGLGLLYLVFAIATALLYPLCRWFRDYKASHSAAWLRFI